MKLHELIYSSQALAARTIRYHTYPTQHKQSTGEHQQRVATLFVELWGMPRVEVLWYIINHDQGEQYAGDSPFGAKRDVPLLKEGVNLAERIGLSKLGLSLPELAEEEFVLFKLADILEMYEFGIIEIAMGNRLAIPIVDKTKIAIQKIAIDFPQHLVKAEWWMSQTMLLAYGVERGNG